MKYSVVLIEDGEQLDLTTDEANYLITKNLIYRCPECGPDMAHCSVDRTVDDSLRVLRAREVTC